MNCSFALINRAKGLSVILSLVSLSMLLYYLIQQELTTIKNREYDLTYFVHLIVPSIALLVNLLLYQAIIDIYHQSLYYWPKPKVCLLWWILIHSIIFLLLLEELIRCIYSYRGQDCLSTSELRRCLNEETNSKSFIIPASIIYTILEVLILYGMKTVFEVLANISRSHQLLYLKI